MLMDFSKEQKKKHFQGDQSINVHSYEWTDCSFIQIIIRNNFNNLF